MVNVAVEDRNEGFFGKTIDYTYLFPSTGNPYFHTAVTVGESVEITDVDGSGQATVDFGATRITIDYFENVTWTLSSFNGFCVFDASGAVSDITGVTLSGVNMNSFLPVLTWDANNIYVNWSGASFSSSTLIFLDVLFSA